jgi:hypothetical protein
LYKKKKKKKASKKEGREGEERERKREKERDREGKGREKRKEAKGRSFKTRRNWSQGLISGVDVSLLVETLCQASVLVHLESHPCDSCSKLQFGKSLLKGLVIGICE